MAVLLANIPFFMDRVVLVAVTLIRNQDITNEDYYFMN